MALHAVALHLERSAAGVVACAATIAGFERFRGGLRPELLVASGAGAFFAVYVRGVSEDYVAALRLENQFFRRLFVLSRDHGAANERDGGEKRDRRPPKRVIVH